MSDFLYTFYFNMEPTTGQDPDKLKTMSVLYEDYFLDYASYVILERAVPALLDGLKPVQRRILHSMKEMDDGRFHKVANIIGQTMQYHPHGDAAIGDALVNMGQKNLLIDCQGNWGDVRTGDSAAAARYIEARLTKFALEIAFNAQTTDWQLTYDGRKKEPILLPVKFPLVLSEGVEGIAVGLSTKILPHNFNELLDASIAILKNEPFAVYPDFQTGGFIDVANYNKGKRGGKVRIRAKIETIDKKTLAIKEIPYSTTTGSLIESILKANDKGVIKVKKVTDNTAKDVELLIELAPGVSPDVTIDALYAFTDCEISVSPNACVILDDRPYFMDVDEILRVVTKNTRELLGKELEIEKNALEEKWHFASLEKIFIENRVYHEIEECETWEAVISTIDTEMRRYIREPQEELLPNDNRLLLTRKFTEEDILRLTEIKIKRISKFNAFKADEYLNQLLADLEKVKYHIAHLTQYTIDYYKRLKEKYGKERGRKTTIAVFDNIEATQVVANNAKLYINREEGFIGMGIKKEEFVADCSDIDDIIVFRKDGKCIVSRIGDKVFVGKNIIYAAVWKKGDERTTYNMIYHDQKTMKSFSKRFNVNAIIRDKEYDLTAGNEGSYVHYFSANQNGEAEIVQVTLHPRSKAKIKVFDYDFAQLAIKGRGSQGNTVSKYPVKKVELKSAGKSTLGARKIWFDDITARLNTDGRGRLLGAFDTGDKILVLMKDGTYELTDFELTNKYNMAEIISINKLNPELVISAIHFEGEKGITLVKRFKVETTSLGQKFSFITEHPKSKLLYASTHPEPQVEYQIKIKSKTFDGTLNLAEFIEIKGWKALGNKLSDQMLTHIKDISAPIEAIVIADPTPAPAVSTTSETPEPDLPEEDDIIENSAEDTPTSEPDNNTPAGSDSDSNKPLKPGDTIDFDVDGQGRLF